MDAVALYLGDERGEGRDDAPCAERGRRRRRADRVSSPCGCRSRDRDGQRVRATKQGRSSSGTSAPGACRLLREPGKDMRQAEWVTRMARLAAAEHDADWVSTPTRTSSGGPAAARYGTSSRRCPSGTASFVAAGVTSCPGLTTGPSSRSGCPSAWRRPPTGRQGDDLPRPPEGGSSRPPEVEIEAGNHNAEAPGLEPSAPGIPSRSCTSRFAPLLSSSARRAAAGFATRARSRPCTRSC